jgi:hypothetical protein
LTSAYSAEIHSGRDHVKLRHLVLAAAAAATALLGFGATGIAGDAYSPAPAYDVSYPQCGSKLPAGGSVAVVGVTDGLPWSTNPCLSSEYKWASGKPQPAAFYMNTANPETASTHWAARAGSGPRTCSDLNDPANVNCAYNYGWNSAIDAVQRAGAATSTATATGHAWWLDVEIGNSWNGSTAANSSDLQASIDYLHSKKVPAVGIYSTSYQWGQITGGYQVGTSGTQPAPANWLAGASSSQAASGWCKPTYSFSGGRVTMVQYPSGNFDGDYLC